MSQDSNNIAVKNPSRILHIFNKICESKLPVLMREIQNQSLAVKGNAVTVQQVGEKHELTIENISNKGLQFLFDKEEIILEFIMLSLKIHCTCPVIQTSETQAVIGLPSALFSMEKRKNARYQTNKNNLSFISLSIWSSTHEDYVSPPFFTNYQKFSSYLPIDNISTEGVCFVSRFPSVFKRIDQQLIDKKSKLILPMTPPISVETNIKWVKSVKNSVNKVNPDQKIITYLAGCQFTNLSQEATHNIKKYIQFIINSSDM